MGRVEPRGHLRTYVEGQLSDLPRNSVEPIALAARWDQGMMRDRVQRVVAGDHAHPLAVGVIDETSNPGRGTRRRG